MRRRSLEDLARDWRTAESRGEEAAADAALAALFRELPLETPPAGFAAATLARARRELSLEAAPASEAYRAPAAARWAAMLLALLSAGTLGLSALVVNVVPRLAPGGAVGLFNQVMVSAWQWIASGITLWARAAEWSALLARLVAVPEVAGSLSGAAVASFLALSLLRRILAHEKEPIYADHG